MAAQVELSENGNLVNGSNPLSTNPNVSRGTGNVDANTQRITLANDDQSAQDINSINTKTPTLDASKTPVIPSMTSGGNLAVTTNATGTTFNAFTSQACKQLNISNQTGVTIEVQQGGAGVALQIPTGAFYTFFGITNTNQLGIRRTDVSNTQVTVTARWEV